MPLSLPRVPRISCQVNGDHVRNARIKGVRVRAACLRLSCICAFATPSRDTLSDCLAGAKASLFGVSGTAFSDGDRSSPGSAAAAPARAHIAISTAKATASLAPRPCVEFRFRRSPGQHGVLRFHQQRRREGREFVLSQEMAPGACFLVGRASFSDSGEALEDQFAVLGSPQERSMRVAQGHPLRSDVVAEPGTPQMACSVGELAWPAVCAAIPPCNRPALARRNRARYSRCSRFHGQGEGPEQRVVNEESKQKG
jgi:hypothetical protein